eukprot:tig00000396_g24915.t1
MLGSAQLLALHQKDLELMPAGGVRIPCTFESAWRQRACGTRYNRSPVEPAACARETAARERLLRRSSSYATST